MTQSIYRNITFFFKGLREYTRTGYESASKSFNTKDLEVDCSGKRYMVTGANSGIGKAAAVEIAKRGGIVHIVCRNKERGEAAEKEIRELTSNDNVFLHQVDMSKPREVSKFAAEFVKSGKPLNVLINNAGCMANTRTLDEDGLETNFATNTLGTHMLTVGLIPALSETENPRVIIVSSAGMLTIKLDPVDLMLEHMNPYDGTFAYAQNKRQQIVMTQQYAKQYRDIHFSAMHPGWADTPGVQTQMPNFYQRMKNKLRTVEQGADTVVWLAVAPAALKHASGLFFQDRKPVGIHLPLAWTKSKAEEEQILMSRLQKYSEEFKHTDS